MGWKKSILDIVITPFNMVGFGGVQGLQDSWGKMNIMPSDRPSLLVPTNDATLDKLNADLAKRMDEVGIRSATPGRSQTIAGQAISKGTLLTPDKMEETGARSKYLVAKTAYENAQAAQAAQPEKKSGFLTKIFE